MPRAREFRKLYQLDPAGSLSAAAERVLPPTSMISNANSQRKPNVAGLGESLYTTHLVTVGLAGVLLFVALVGAVVITDPSCPNRRQTLDDSPRLQYLFEHLNMNRARRLFE